MSAAPPLAGLAAAFAAAGAALLGAEWRAARGVGSAPAGAPHLLRLLIFGGARLAHASARPPRDLEARIAAAGRPAGLGARELMAAKLAGAAAAAAAGLAAAATAPGPARLGPLLAIAAPVAGFLAPDLWLARRAAERARVMRRELPALLDLLRVAVQSGSSLAAALAAVGARARGPLAGELRAVTGQVGLGVPLERALADLAKRAPLPEVAALVGALERARRHGVPLAEALGAQARDARFALTRHAREEAARAGPKIQLVVALLLVPSVLLLVAAALLAALLRPDGPVAGGAALPI